MEMTAYTFWNLRHISEIFWMTPLMGFAQLSLFGGYAILLGRAFPTRLRRTGTSFCHAGVTMCLVILVGLAAQWHRSPGRCPRSFPHRRIVRPGL
jgi:hypothetical protein